MTRHFLICILISSVLLISPLLAQNNQIEESNSFLKEIPVPSKETVFFDDLNKGFGSWVVSQVDKYTGLWNVRQAVGDVAVVGDLGLAADSEARHHAIAVEFDSVVDNTEKDLYIQYEVRFENGLECGGAYIKLLSQETMPSELGEFSNETPYTIMFGPDKCGTNNKVHFIFRHQNPITGEFEEKHFNNPPRIASDSLTHLYTLHISPENTFEILIDGQVVAEGNLLEDFEPAVNPPAEIDDSEDMKPEDWIDEPLMADTTAVKPDDWDEDAPSFLVDEEAVMPEGWLENEPDMIPDPSQTKPADWDDDLDGDFEAEMVQNPKCDVGCGKWEKPLIPNPEYKGKWSAPLVENPDYIGVWTPRQIPNPNFFVDETPYKVTPIGGLGIEIWTMQSGILFDNIVVSYDGQFVEKLQGIFAKKNTEELRLKALSEPSSTFNMEALEQFVQIVTKYVKDEKNFWVVVGSSVAGILIPLLLCLLKPKKTPQPKTSPKKKNTTKYVEEKEEDE